MKKLIQILVVVFTIGIVAMACEPVEVDEDMEEDMEEDPMMEEEGGGEGEGGGEM
ncbi:MAG: hypothetical protein ACLFM0_06715 [Spirochaetales bacterium]